MGTSPTATKTPAWTRPSTSTEQFFRCLGVGTRLADYNIPREAVELVAKRLAKRRMKLGEHQDLGEKEVKEILALRVMKRPGQDSPAQSGLKTTTLHGCEIGAIHDPNP